MNKKHKSEITTFLFARPSFLEGLARVVDFGNALKEYNSSSTAEKADERAIRADWQAVADDMNEALEKNISNHKNNGR